MIIPFKFLALVIFLFTITPQAFSKNNDETEITVTLNTELFRTIYLFLNNRIIKEAKNKDVIKFKVKKGKHLICATVGGLLGGRPDKCNGGTNHIYKYDNVELVWADDGKGAWYRFYLIKEYDNEKPKPSRTINEARMLCLQSGFKFGTKAFDQCIQTSTQ